MHSVQHLHNVHIWGNYGVMPMATPPLRAQLRAATRRRIADAAMDLATETSVRSLRADDIAARVGISRRTFFNYVSTTEAALSIPVEDYLQAARHHFVARPADAGIITSMVTALGEIEPDVLARFERMLLIVTADASFHQPGVHAWDRSEREVRDAIAERLPPGTDPLYITTLAAAVMGAGRAAARAWAADVVSGTAGSPDLGDYTTRALGHLAAIERARPAPEAKGAHP